MITRGIRKGIGGHQSYHAHTVEWLTPPDVLKPLGRFDLDPCAPAVRPWPMAARHFTRAEDGLSKVWGGRVWLNPPYGVETGPWLKRLAEHGDGIAIIFARTETEMFFRWGWGAASAMLFFRGRLHFHHLDGSRAKDNAGGPSVLIAYGARNVKAIREAGLAGCFVDLAERELIGIEVRP